MGLVHVAALTLDGVVAHLTLDGVLEEMKASSVARCPLRPKAVRTYVSSSSAACWILHFDLAMWLRFESSQMP